MESNPAPLVHIAFVLQFLAFAAIRFYWFAKTAPSRAGARLLEPQWAMWLRLVLGLPMLALIAAYFVRPGILAFADVPMPTAARAVGIALGIGGLALLWWVQRTLGDNFHSVLHVRKGHTLVTDGPYRYVRHPMYTTFYIIAAAYFLMTGNLVIAALWTVPLTSILLVRTRREEATMRAEFGSAYADYAARTGRFVPRFG
ncbi:MAG: isoprenylcysteine carboxylmethyltransferase family protein [Ardenticatenales bacterium]|nr:isoprenylcysteine carboxylmethyltransferase family protein [Ardenticatenales bacterium]